MICRRALLRITAAAGIVLSPIGGVLAHVIDRTMKITPLKKSKMARDSAEIPVRYPV